jgi:lipopolysaccharide export system protein LptC
MKNSRIALVLLALAALSAVGFSAVASETKMKAADGCGSHCPAGCTGCCHH